MSTLGQKAKHELNELIPVTVFFFAAFQLPALTNALIMKQYGIRVPGFFFRAPASSGSHQPYQIESNQP